MSQDSFGFLIKKLELRSDRLSSQFLQKLGLSTSQFRVLRWLFKQEGSPRQHDVEKALSLSNPTVTGILHNLEKHGWVKRLPHPEDKRSKQLVLTDKAKGQQQALYQISQDVEAELTRDLSREETQQLRQLIQKILKENSDVINT